MKAWRGKHCHEFQRGLARCLQNTCEVHFIPREEVGTPRYVLSLCKDQPNIFPYLIVIWDFPAISNIFSGELLSSWFGFYARTYHISISSLPEVDRRVSYPRAGKSQRAGGNTGAIASHNPQTGADWDKYVSI